MKPDLSKIRHIVLDMDGTLYLGGTIFADTLPSLAALRRLGIGYSFVTNNCSRSRADYANHLNELGIDASPESIWTSAHATISYLRSALPTAERLFVLGTQSLHDEFRQAGFGVVDVEPDAIVVSFDTHLTYDRLAHTAYWISKGLPYVATHPDRVCPTDRPIVLPDCGAICALFESATGRRPQAIPGKPNRAMLDAVMEAYDLAPHEVAMIGDRLYTDIRMAKDAGVLAILTLTGETRQQDVDKCDAHQRPDLVVKNLAELTRQFEESRHDP
jgi:HAD superfamily hydrolase (TIGR01450 family)